MKSKAVVWSFLLLMVLLFVQGCFGYRLGSTLPPDLRTIYVPLFINRSDEPLIENKATNATIAEFQKDGTLKIVKLDEADLILECTLTGITLKPLRYRSDDRSKPNEYRMTLNASFVLKRAETGEVIGKDSVYGESTFIYTSNLTSAKLSAVPRASEDLAERIVEKVVEVW